MHRSTLTAQADRLAASGEAVRRAVGFDPSTSSQGAGWNSVALFAWRGHCDEASFEALSEPAIVYHTAGALSVPVRAHRSWNQRSHPALVTIIPADTPIVWNVRGEVHSFSVHLGSRLFESLTEESRATALERLPFRCGVSDPFLSASISELWRELRLPTQQGSLYADTMCDMIALHLMRSASARPAGDGRGSRLSPTALRRTLDLLESRTETGVSLADLSRTAGLSRAYFATAFRNTIGLSPHRYLMERRVTLAQELLRDSTLSLAEIAVRCGFASQAHFTFQFRRQIGTTPSRFRRT